MSGYHYQISEASRLLAVEAHVLRYWEEELGMIIPRNEMGHRYYTEEHLRIFSQIKDMKERGYQLRAIRAILSGEEPPETPITEIPLKKDKDQKSQKEELRGEHLDSPGQASVDMPSERNSSEPVKIPRTRPLPSPEIPVPDTQQPEETQPQRKYPEQDYGQDYGSDILSEPQYRQEVQLHADSQTQAVDSRMDQFQAVMTHIIAQAMLCNNPGLANDISRQIEENLMPEIYKMMNSSESRQEERFRKLDESIRCIQQGNRARYEAAAAKSPGLFGRRKRKQRYRRI